MAAQPPQPPQSSLHTQIYTFVPLPLGSSDSIRLLRILDSNPEDGDAPISCELHVGSTNDPYVALSYVWAQVEGMETIMLNGLPISVRKNLWDFLFQRRKDQRQDHQHVRRDYDTDAEPTYLWVDALCIDQATNLERNHQVAMMGRIYSSARTVIAWLGSESAHFKIVDELSAFASGNNALNPVPYYRWDQLYSHEYWGRAWILQECILARELRVQCGSRHFSDTVLLSFALDSTPLENGWNLHNAVRVLKTRTRWHNASAEKYFCPWSIPFFGRLKCSDPRDRVYSAIAIMDPAISIVPDYSKDAEKLFVEIADQHIEWDEHRAFYVESLASLLDLADSRGDLLEAVEGKLAVKQIFLEAEEFEQSGKTKSDFLANRNRKDRVTISHRAADKHHKESRTSDE
jgi:hypothetical protein